MKILTIAVLIALFFVALCQLHLTHRIYALEKVSQGYALRGGELR